MEYIALEQRQILAPTLEKASIFSIQVNGSCDSANIEDELFIALYFDPYTSDGKIMFAANFFLYGSLLVPMLLISLKISLELLHVLILLTGNLN